MPWGPPVPPGPRRPAQVTAAAVLTFVQAGVVVLASLYVLLLVALFSYAAAEVPVAPQNWAGLATEGTGVAVLQLLSAVALVGGGVLALRRPSRRAGVLLLSALGLQLALAGYWAVRLVEIVGNGAGPDPSGLLLLGALVFAAAPGVALGLALSRPARRWFDGSDPQGRQNPFSPGPAMTG